MKNAIRELTTDELRIVSGGWAKEEEDKTVDFPPVNVTPDDGWGGGWGGGWGPGSGLGDWDPPSDWYYGGGGGGGGGDDSQASDQVTNLARLLVQLTELKVAGTNTSSTVFMGIDLANLSLQQLKTAVQDGLRDINYYRSIGDHIPTQYGALPWQTWAIDWDKYGASDSSLSDEDVFRNWANQGYGGGK